MTLFSKGNAMDTPPRKPRTNPLDIGMSAMSDPLRWAFELETKPSAATANWLVGEIIPGSHDAFTAVLAPTTSLAQLVELKNAFKSMRVSGATIGERRLAARLYAGTIATAVVRWNARISSQPSISLFDAFTALSHDSDIPEALRDIAELAVEGLPVLPPLVRRNEDE